MTDKNTKSEVKNNVSKTSKKVSEIKEENKKHRQYNVGGVFISLILVII